MGITQKKRLFRSAGRPHKRAFSIRKKLYFLRIGVGVFMGILVGVCSFWIAAMMIQKHVREGTTANARMVGKQVQTAVRYMGDSLSQMATSDEMEKYYHSRRKALLAALFRKHTQPFDKISYINTQGVIEASLVQNRLMVEETPIIPSDNYARALKTPNTTIFGELAHDPDLQTPVLRLYHQQIDFFDNRLGMLQGSVALDALSRHLDRIFQEKDIYSVLITDAQGRILYGPKPEDYGRAGQGILPEAMLRPSDPNKSVFMGKQRVYGASSLVATNMVMDLNWRVFVVKSMDAIHQPLYRLCISIFLLTLGVIFCGEVLSRRIGVKIIEPIKRLRQVTADIIHDGNLEKRVDWTSDDEMGQLADAFNAMLEKINNTQNQLQKERQFNDNIIDSATGLLIVVSSAWDIMRVNPHVGHLLGYRQDELLGQAFQMLMPTERTLFTEVAEQKVSDGAVLALEKQLQPKHGQPIPISLKISEIMDHRHVRIGYLITGTDIRAKLKRKAEKKLAAEKLASVQEDLLKTEKLAIVGQMSGMVAHEVLNPISAIYARLDLNIKEEKEIAKVHSLLHKILSDWQQQLAAGDFEPYFQQNGPKDLQLLMKIADVIHKKDGERVENLNFIYKLIRRVIRIVDNLREMSRRKKTPEKIDLTKLIDEVVGDMGDGLRKRKIEVRKNYDAHPEFSADYMEVYSIFSNILKNAEQAIDAHRENDDKKITIDLWQSGSMTSIQIKDTGIGIDLDTQKKLFQTGFSNKGREGTGLGLSYSRKLTRQLGGDMFLVRSIPGKGCTFQVNFSSQRSEDEKRVA